MILLSKSYLKIALFITVAGMAMDGTAMKRNFEDASNTSESNKKQNTNYYVDSLEIVDQIYTENKNATDLFSELAEQELLENRYNELVKDVKKAERIINFADLKKDKKQARALVTIEEITDSLQDFVDMQHKKLSKSSLWLDNKTPDKLKNDKYKHPKVFVPFVGKKIFEEDQKFMVFGDLHEEITLVDKISRR